MRSQNLVFPLSILVLGVLLQAADNTAQTKLPQEFVFDRQQAVSLVKNKISQSHYPSSAHLDFEHPQFGTVRAVDVCGDSRETIGVILVCFPFKSDRKTSNCYHLIEFGDTWLMTSIIVEIKNSGLKSHVAMLKRGDLFDCPH